MLRTTIILTSITMLLGACADQSDYVAYEAPYKEKGNKRVTKVEGVTVMMPGRSISPEKLHDLVHPIMVSWSRSQDKKKTLFNKKHLVVKPYFSEECKNKGWYVTLNNGSILPSKPGHAAIKFTDRRIREAKKITFVCEPISYVLGVGGKYVRPSSTS